MDKVANGEEVKQMNFLSKFAFQGRKFFFSFISKK